MRPESAADAGPSALASSRVVITSSGIFIFSVGCSPAEVPPVLTIIVVGISKYLACRVLRIRKIHVFGQKTDVFGLFPYVFDVFPYVFKPIPDVFGLIPYEMSLFPNVFGLFPDVFKPFPYVFGLIPYGKDFDSRTSTKQSAVGDVNYEVKRVL